MTNWWIGRPGIRLTVIAVMTSLLLIASPVVAAPSSDLWERWLPHDEDSTVTVDHTTWDNLLRKFVIEGGDGINRVAYKWIMGSEKQSLNRYLEELSRVSVTTLNRAEQRAYWINLYNALTIRVVLDAGQVASIRDIDISPGLLSNGPWGKELITIEGENLSLDDIEHRILRPIWQDPRIHYALNCAALGCPNIWALAVTSRNAETYLDSGAEAFINHPRGVRVENGRVVASSIYKWFSEDFGDSDEALLDHLKLFASGDLAQKLDGVTAVTFDDYDWTLNSTDKPEPKFFSSNGGRVGS